MLGTVLYRYNFLDDFGQFANKQSFAISNISKVQLSLERFKIKFDPHRIINKEPGYALKLLEKIHKALHTVTNTSPINHKAHTLSEIPFISKQERLSIRLKKFEDFRAAQAQLAFEKEKNANERIFQSKLKERTQRLDILKSNHSFMQT